MCWSRGGETKILKFSKNIFSFFKTHLLRAIFGNLHKSLKRCLHYGKNHAKQGGLKIAQYFLNSSKPTSLEQFLQTYMSLLSGVNTMIKIMLS